MTGGADVQVAAAIRAVELLIGGYARSIADGKPATLTRVVEDVHRQFGYAHLDADAWPVMVAYACAQAAGAKSRLRDGETWPEHGIRKTIVDLQRLLDDREQVRRDAAAQVAGTEPSGLW